MAKLINSAALLSAMLLSAPVHAEDAPVTGLPAAAGILADDDAPDNPARVPQSARISVQTFGAHDVENRQARTVTDLLNHGTGVIATSSGMNAAATLNVLGDGEFTYIIDGAYIPSLLASRILQTIPAAAIEEVRIVRTAGALAIAPLVGMMAPSAEATKGVVIIRTRRGEGTGAMVRLHGGSFNTLGADGQIAASFTVGAADAYVRAMGSSHATDGPEGYNLDRNYKVLGLKGGFGTGIFALDLSVLKTWSSYGLGRANTSLRPYIQQEVRRLDPQNALIATASGSLHWDAHNATLMTLAYTKANSNLQSANIASGNVRRRDSTNMLWNAGIRHNLLLGSTNLQAGADFVYWNNPSGQLYYLGNSRKEEVSGYFLQADQSLFGGRLTLDIAARLDRTLLIRGTSYELSGRGPRTFAIRNVQQPDAKYLSAGASWNVAGDWRINGRYAHLSRGAQQGVVLDSVNRPLKDGRRSRWDLGVEGPVSGWLRSSLNGFIIKTTNEVLVTAAMDYDDFVDRFSNTDGRRAGVEAIVAGQWGEDGRKGSLRASITHHFTISDPTGLLARIQPRTVAEVTAEQAFGSWRIGGAGKYVSHHESAAATRCDGAYPNCWFTPPFPSPYRSVDEFVRIDINLSRRFVFQGQAMRVTASVLNLLDDHDEPLIGYPLTGREFGLELTAEF